jgi:RHS repeat-associated protein
MTIMLAAKEETVSFVPSLALRVSIGVSTFNPSKTHQGFAGSLSSTHQAIDAGNFENALEMPTGVRRNGSGVICYGEEITSTNNDTYKFAQTYRDSDSGLDYAVNRYYSSGLGRFITVDRDVAVSGRPQSWNRYAYTEADPVNSADATGLSGRKVDSVLCDPSTESVEPDPAPHVEDAGDCYNGPTGDPSGPGGSTAPTCAAALKSSEFSSDAFTLGLTNFFEYEAVPGKNGSIPSTAVSVWTGIDWTFVNQSNLTAAQDLLFFGSNGAPASTVAGLAMAGSQVWSNGQLASNFQNQLYSIEGGPASSPQCQGLIAAIDVAAGVLGGTIPDNVGGALQFSSGRVPGHGRGVGEKKIIKFGPFTFYQPIFPTPGKRRVQ